MATNLYFSQKVQSDLPRDIVNEDKVFGDDVPSRFNSSYKIEMYIENIEGFDGEGDLFTKFGVEIRDQATFVVARRRWTQTINRYVKATWCMSHCQILCLRLWRLNMNNPSIK